MAFSACRIATLEHQLEARTQELAALQQKLGELQVRHQALLGVTCITICSGFFTCTWAMQHEGEGSANLLGLTCTSLQELLAVLPTCLEADWGRARISVALQGGGSSSGVHGVLHSIATEQYGWCQQSWLHNCLHSSLAPQSTTSCSLTSVAPCLVSALQEAVGRRDTEISRLGARAGHNPEVLSLMARNESNENMILQLNQTVSARVVVLGDAFQGWLGVEGHSVARCTCSGGHRRIVSLHRQTG